MKYTAIRRIQFCSGHRVYKHESKCANMHGHNYVAFFHAEAENLDDIGRVIDFSVLKEKFGTWIDKNWDHGFLYFRGDLELVELFDEQMNSQKHFEMPCNPTAENMAQFLLDLGKDLLQGSGVKLVKVVLWETENCFVEVV